MKRLILLSATISLIIMAAMKPDKSVAIQAGNPHNTLTANEIKEGWKLLFDGKTSSGWINAKTKKFPVSGWEIKDGVLLGFAEKSIKYQIL
jgi:hypothetical protein